ncbi:hypothetical protein F53441_7458 [Fusarium austroafricanum]|uniref:Heterokaryon incompatibility domain-containing protein n=1 Tax=Fusarium austroafricanum TaxID=2364996 RepID=A0A8H4KGE2_9HYPO|nr:hypothetical protein F53441_7458 [Fusarium austroafricanum]
MSLRVIPTSSSTSGFCPWCEEFLRREPSDDDECLVQSREAIKMAAKQGCFICGWLVLTHDLETLHSLYLDIPSSSNGTLMSISYTKVATPGWVTNPRYVIFNVIDDRDHSASSSPYYPPDFLQLESSSFRNLVTKWMETFKIIDKRSLQVICSSDLDGTVDYVALSHRWENPQPLKLLQSNLAQLRTKIQMKSLPKTYKMAITACKALQFQYIWIDSLCIIQDSEEDWQKEAATMHLVYGNSALNICMPGAATTRDARLIKPLAVRVEKESEPPTSAHMVCAQTCHRDLFFSPLRDRGWVFQESFLSKRSLVLGCVQLWWHCHEQLACETFPEGTDYGARFGPGVVEKAEFSAMKLGDSDANEYKDAYSGSSYQSWSDIVEQYAGTRLTHETDRVIAFSGVAQAFRLSHNINGQYLAGIWSCNLPEGLLWYRHDTAVSRSNSYKAPSWSWMSIDGPYNLYQEFDYATRSCCSIEQIYLRLRDEKHDTGLLDGGALRIRGHLVRPLPDDTSLDTLEEAILACHVSTEEEAVGGVCMVNEDEEGPDGVPFISYLDGLDQESTHVGLTSGAFRQKIAFSEAKGSIFCLPVVYRYEDNGEPYASGLSGLILYHPSHQPGIYHRIGYYELECEEIPDFETLLREEHPLESILIY